MTGDAYQDADLRTLVRVEAAAQAELAHAQRSLVEARIDRARAKLAAIRRTLDARHPRWREQAA